MFRKFFSRWNRSPSFTAQELQILDLLLPDKHPSSNSLRLQATRAPYVERRLIGGAGYEATIPYVMDDALLIDCERDIASPNLEVVDLRTNRRLCFSTSVARGGYLRGIRGLALDGNRWPKNWAFSVAQIHRDPDHLSWLDDISPQILIDTVLPRLAQWCGLDQREVSNEQRSRLRFRASASDANIQDCEMRLGIHIDGQFKDFVRFTNGFGIARGRPYEILGTTDIEFANDSRDVIVVTPLFEAGYVGLKVVDSFLSDTCLGFYTGGNWSEIGDFKTHVRESLLWKV